MSTPILDHLHLMYSKPNLLELFREKLNVVDVMEIRGIPEKDQTHENAYFTKRIETLK